MVELACGSLPREFGDETALTPQAKRVYDAAQQWPTPRAYSFAQSHAPGLTSLDIRVPGLYPDKGRYWPTPNKADGLGGRIGSEETVLSGKRPSGSKAQISLIESIRYWPTPSAMNPNETEDLGSWQERRARVKAEQKNGNGFGMPLGVAVRLENQDESGHAAHQLNEHYEDLTPEEIDHYNRMVNDAWGRQAPSQNTALWPTPRHTDAAKGGSNQHGDLMLPSAVNANRVPPVSAKPAAGDWRQGGYPADEARKSPNLNTAARWATPHAPPQENRTTKATPSQKAGKHGAYLAVQVNEQATTDRPQMQAGTLLNPDWEEVLQGLPIGWTNPNVANEDLEPWPGWPSRPGQEQFAYEPARTTAGMPKRNKRVECLGDLVPPQQAYPIFAAIMAVHAEMHRTVEALPEAAL